MFVQLYGPRLVDWSDTPLRVVFDETLDELWESVAGLSSLFSPRKPLSNAESPTPGALHHSLRDFAFNKARCGEELHYSTEKELHTEIVCKIIRAFNNRQSYQVRDSIQNLDFSNIFVKSGAEKGAWFFARVNSWLEIHLKEAAMSDELGRCMDDITLDYIPSSWPLVTQVFVAFALFGGLYRVAEHPVSEL